MWLHRCGLYVYTLWVFASVRLWRIFLNSLNILQGSVFECIWEKKCRDVKTNRSIDVLKREDGNFIVWEDWWDWRRRGETVLQSKNTLWKLQWIEMWYNPIFSRFVQKNVSKELLTDSQKILLLIKFIINWICY